MGISGGRDENRHSRGHKEGDCGLGMMDERWGT